MNRPPEKISIALLKSDRTNMQYLANSAPRHSHSSILKSEMIQISSMVQIIERGIQLAFGITTPDKIC